MLRILLCLVLIASSARAETAVTRLWEDKAFAKLRALDAGLNGVLGVASIDLTSGRVFVYNGEAVFPTASTIKVPIMIEFFRRFHAGEFRLDEPVVVDPKEDVGGSTGPLSGRLKAGPVRTTWRGLLNDMIQFSDNTATNKLIDLVRMERVNRLMDQFGFHATRLLRHMMDLDAAKRGQENVSSPVELARAMELIYRERAADPQSCRDMLTLLKKVQADVRAVVPEDIEVASKPGDLDAVHAEIAVVYLPDRPYIVSIMSTYLDENQNPVRQAASIVHEYFQKLARSNQYGRKLQ